MNCEQDIKTFTIANMPGALWATRHKAVGNTLRMALGSPYKRTKPMPLSDTAKAALAACYATRGPHKGQLLARCPKSDTLAAAAWQGAMLICNPYKASVAACLFMSAEQRAIRDEV